MNELQQLGGAHITTQPYVHETQEVEQVQIAVKDIDTSLSLFGTDDPVKILEAVTQRAKVLKDVIQKQGLFKKIGPREHVLVEGWTFCGTMCGIFPRCEWVHELKDGEEIIGFEARVEAVNRQGQVIGAAQARCMRAEANWKNRDLYALESMAQTRATGKVFRLLLSFIVVLAGYDPTPREEIPPDSPAEVPEADLKPGLKASLEQAKANRAAAQAQLDEKERERPRTSERAQEDCPCGSPGIKKTAKARDGKPPYDYIVCSLADLGWKEDAHAKKLLSAIEAEKGPNFKHLWKRLN